MTLEESFDQEIYLQGSPISEGIAIGTLFHLSSAQEESIPEFSIAVGEVDSEISRYRQALFSSREDLRRLQTDLAFEGSTDAATIFDAHIQMLQDPFMTTHVEDKIRQMNQNTESVFRSVITEYESRLSQTSDSFFQQRFIDVMDVSKRILGHLNNKQKPLLSEIPPNSIVFAKILIPSHTASVHVSRVGAFLTQTGGGGYSHAALIARAKGIPYVDNIDVHVLQSAKGKVIVDGQTGYVIINPTASTLRKYTRLKRRLSTHYQSLEKEVHLASETQDGYLVSICANIESIHDFDGLYHHNAAGVGLFRSEYLFLQDPTFFSSEEKQFAAYVEFVQSAKGLPIVFRALDVGGDKIPQLALELEKEPNPVLGCRGIRFLLRYKELFKTQLRALLRATAFGDLHLLLPLISDIGELRQAKNIIEEIRKECLDKQIKIAKHIPIGCMIEVPSAAFMADAIMAESDFLSIGTNDLFQYTLGVDRSHPTLREAFSPAHPSILRLLKLLVLQANRMKKPLSVCGEMASNPLFIPVLLGLGIKQFSCAPRYIPVVKRAVRETSLLDAYQMVEKILSLHSSAEVTAFLN